MSEPATPRRSAASRRAVIRRLQLQKAVLAEFGVEAFGTDDLDALLTRAASLASQGLDVERSKVLELMPSGDCFLIRAGVGWEPDIVGKSFIDASSHSPAGYALLSGRPVVSEDLLNDRRFSCPDILRRHGIKSAVNVIIRGKERPVGVLEVDSQERRSFTQDDVNFLQGFANLLAAAIDRLTLHRRLTDAAFQKEVLLHELQHRVKNSLQVIASIINLQRRKSPHDLVRLELDVIASRIEALRMLYSKLYLVNHHAEINFCDYMRELCHSLVEYHQPPERAVTVDVDCLPINLHLDRAAPLGLLTAEFIINSFKHAFPKAGSRLAVLLAPVAERTARLILADDGPGMLASDRAGDGLGLRLIEQLAQAGRCDRDLAPRQRHPP